MRVKRALALSLMIIILAVMAVPAYAGGHGNGKHSGGGHHNGRAPAVTWHSATDYYGGHYSSQCAQYKHVWHSATRGCNGHYSFGCAGFGHRN